VIYPKYNIMKVWIYVLVSHTMDFVHRAVQSVQESMAVYQGVPVNFQMVVMINTKNKEFEQACNQAYPEAVVSESNGAPGKGHNACLLHFLSNAGDDDRFLLLDGDDALYPAALTLLSHVWSHDTVFLMVHDQIAVDQRPHRHVRLSPHFYLYTAHGIERNFWSDHALGNPFTEPLSNCRTPARLLTASKKGCTTLHFDEQCVLYDDYLPFIQSVHGQLTGSLDMCVISHTDIYCYHACSEESATLKFMNLFTEQMRVRETIAMYERDLFASHSNWMDVLQTLPYQPLGGPTWSMTQKVEWVKKRFVETEISVKLKLALETQVAKQFEKSLKYWRLLDSFGVLSSSILTNIGANWVEWLKTRGFSLKSPWKTWHRHMFHAFYRSLWLEPSAIVLKNMVLFFGEQGKLHRVRELFQRIQTLPSDPMWEPVWDMLKQTYQVEEEAMKPRARRIVMYTGMSPPFHGGSVDKSNVYGSELAAIGLAESLVELRPDLKVTIVCEMDQQPTMFRGVQYVSTKLFESQSFDVLILSRFLWVINETWLRQRLMENPSLRVFFWIHDARVHEWSPYGKLPLDGKLLFRNVLPRLEHVICVSDWHRDWFTQWSGCNDALPFDVIPNGIPNETPIPTDSRVNSRFIWPSDPSRGLSVLLAMFRSPVFQSTFPDWSLDIYFHHISPDLKTEISTFPPDRIRFHGRIPPQQLQVEFQTADFFLYPLIGHETFCINVLEAQRQGCIVVAPNSTGLRTSAPYALLVDGHPSTSNWQEMVLTMLSELQTNASKKEQVRQRTQEWARSQTWKHQVERHWLPKIEK
jgi:hypothetical protein